MIRLRPIGKEKCCMAQLVANSYFSQLSYLSSIDDIHRFDFSIEHLFFIVDKRDLQWKKME